MTFKTDFLAQMSHEIRTPLNGIIGSLEFLQDSKDLEKKEELFSIIKESSFDLLNIVNDILQLSKLEAGEVYSHIEPCNLEKIINTCTNLYKQKIRAHISI